MVVRPIPKKIDDMCSEIPDPLPLRRTAHSLFESSVVPFGGQDGRYVAAAFVVMAARQLGRLDAEPRNLFANADINPKLVYKKIRAIELETGIRFKPTTAKEIIALGMDLLDVPVELRCGISANALRISEILKSNRDLSEMSAAATGLYNACIEQGLHRSQRVVCAALDISSSYKTLVSYNKVYREWKKCQDTVT